MKTLAALDSVDDKSMVHVQGALVHRSTSDPAFIYDTETFSRTLGMTWDIDTRNAAS